MAVEIKEERPLVKINARDNNKVIVQEVNNQVKITGWGPQGIQGPPGSTGIIIAPNSTGVPHDVLWLDTSIIGTGAVNSIDVTAPIINSGTSSDVIIELNQSALIIQPNQVVGTAATLAQTIALAVALG